MSRRIEPREHVSDAALASGDMSAWKQVLGFPSESASPRCSSCDARAEQWWNYCAMCGWHIAADVVQPSDRMTERQEG
jgi:predicted amidophosphoribosyltransferase